MMEKVVELKKAIVVARGCAEHLDESVIASGRAVIYMSKPKTIEIDGKFVQSTSEIPDVICRRTLGVHPGAWVISDVGKVLIYFFSDGEYGHAIYIPDWCLEPLGYRKVKEHEATRDLTKEFDESEDGLWGE